MCACVLGVISVLAQLLGSHSIKLWIEPFRVKLGYFRNSRNKENYTLLDCKIAMVSLGRQYR